MKLLQSIPVLHHTCRPPKLRRGERTFCLVRDCLVVVTGWSDAPLSWPLCRRVEAPGFPGILVEEELARAIEQESAAAVMHWWGVSSFTVAKWRRALGVNRQNNEGSQILIHAAAAKAREIGEQQGPSEVYRQKQREHTIRRRLWELAPQVTHGMPWTPGQLALLGTLPDREVARLTGHPLFSVKITRQKLRIPGYAITIRAARC